MRIPRIRGINVLTILILVFLVVLAVLQWRWVLVLGRAEEARRETALRAGVARFALEFDTYVIGAYIYFRPDPQALRRRTTNLPEWFSAQYAAAMKRWNAVARYPRLVKNVYWVEAGPDANRVFVLRGRDLKMQPVEPPPEMGGLLTNLRMTTGQVMPRDEGRSTQSETTMPALVATGVPAIVISLDQQAISQPVTDAASEGRPNHSARDLNEAVKGVTRSYILVELDFQYIARDFIPMLLKNNLDEEATKSSFVIADRHDPKNVLFSSTASPDSVLMAPDAQALLFAVKSPSIRHDFPAKDVEGHWLLAARKTDSPVELLAATNRFWTLVTTFGSLLLLTVSIGLMMISTRRLQSTARQKIDFVAGVSHELYSPLAVIRSAAEDLVDGAGHNSQEDSLEYARLISRETQRLVEMVDNTLEFAGIELAKREYDLRPVDLRDLVEGTVEELRPRLEGASMSAAVDIPADLPPVLADQLALTQVIQNLVINAIKYAGAGGWVGISARRAGGPRDKGVLLEVMDRGPGIETADLPHVLEPFYRGANARTANVPGSGLGLALVTRIIAAHGGRVWVESRAGLGTRISITLPSAEAAAGAV